MKLSNTLFYTAALVAIIGTSSCTKEYTCQCTIKYSGRAGMPDSSINEYPIKDTKKNAQSICEGNSATFNKDNVQTIEKCLLF